MLSVDNINQSPEIYTEAQESVDEYEDYRYTIGIEDRDLENGSIGEVIHVELEGPEWITLNEREIIVGDYSIERSVEGSPTLEHVGRTYGVTINVTDKFGGLDQEVFSVEVVNVNDPPEFELVLAQSVHEGESYRYEIQVSDLDEAISNLTNNSSRYFKLFFKKLFSYYFIDINSNYPNYYNFFHIFPIIILSILYFPGLFIFFKMSKFENKCLGLYLFTNLIIFSVFFILPRYKFAILPIQIILTGYFIQYLLNRLNIK